MIMSLLSGLFLAIPKNFLLGLINISNIYAIFSMTISMRERKCFNNNLSVKGKHLLKVKHMTQREAQRREVVGILPLLIVHLIKFLEITNGTDLQSLFFDLISSHDELSNFLVWDFLLVAVFVGQIQSLDTKLSFQAARLVVNSGVNYSAKRFTKISI